MNDFNNDDLADMTVEELENEFDCIEAARMELIATLSTDDDEKTRLRVRMRDVIAVYKRRAKHDT